MKDSEELVAGKLVIPEGVTEIEDHAFENRDDIKVVEIPSSVEVIGKYAFSWCRHLKTVRFNGPVRKIEDEAFCHCTDLNEIYLPSGLTSIGTMAFSDCAFLLEIMIPDSVKRIGDDAFMNCDNLETVYISDPDLLEGTSVGPEVSIITDFDYDEIMNNSEDDSESGSNPSIKAHVGQVIKDLENLVKLNPGSELSYSDEYVDLVVNGIQVRDGIVIFEACEDCDDPITVDELYAELKKLNMDSSAGVILEYSDYKDYLYNFDPYYNCPPYEDGSFFNYYEEAEANEFYISLLEDSECE